MAAPGTPEYLALAVLLALLGGLQLLLLGLLRMAFVVNLLSHPVISGFITGSAVLIALGQVRRELILGIDGTCEERAHFHRYYDNCC